MNIKENLVSQSKYNIKCPYYMEPIGICIHNTSNNAPAKNEISYMINNNNQVSFHYAVDDIEVIQGLPLNRNAWASGDGGNGEGNRKHIHIEICYSTGDINKFLQSEKNCVKLVVYLMNKYGWDISCVKKHQDFSNKYCPHKTLDLGWERFLNMIRAELGQSPIIETNEDYNDDSSSNTEYEEHGTATVIVDKLNIRDGSSTSSYVVGSYGRGETFTYNYVRIVENMVWVRYTAYSGKIRWVCVKNNGVRYANCV